MGRLHVVAGLIEVDGEVLLAQRQPGKHLAGLWELPGGKVEPGESAEAALRRELKEELDLDFDEAIPFVRLDHDYPSLAIDFEVWRIVGLHGEPRSAEGQALRWAAPPEMVREEMPAASWPVLDRLLAAGNPCRTGCAPARCLTLYKLP